MDPNQIILNDFITRHPFATAKALEVLGPNEVGEFLLELPLQKGLNILSLMNPESASKCFVLLPTKQRAEYLEKGKPSVMAAILKTIDGPLQNDLLKTISPHTAAMIRRELEFRPDTVGLLAEPAMTVLKEMTVNDATDIFKKSRTAVVSELYVVDLDGIFQGLVETAQLLMSDKSDTLEGIMVTTCPRFSADQPISSVLEDEAWLHYRHIPIVDRADKFIGAISYRSVMAIAGKTKNRANDAINESASALGELYRIGLTGLLQSTGKE